MLGLVMQALKLVFKLQTDGSLAPSGYQSYPTYLAPDQ